MNNKKILTLRICRPWFEKLIAWETKYRYREVKKYWEIRLLDKEWYPKEFDEIHIKNWYNENSPVAIIEFWWIEWVFEHEWKDCFKIKLWKIIEIKNFNI